MSDEKSTWGGVNPIFAVGLDSDRLGKLEHDGEDSELYARQSLSEGVSLMAWRGNLIEGYIKSEVRICLHLHSRLPTVYAETGDFVFVFQHEHLPSDNQFGESRTFRESNQWTDVSGLTDDDVQLSVSVLSRPVVQNTDATVVTERQLAWREVRNNTVRLYAFHNAPLLLREWRNLPTRTLEMFGGIADRKFEGVFIGWRSALLIDAGDLVDSSVKGGAALIQKLANFERHVRRQRPDSLDDDGTCPVCIYIGVRTIGFVFDERIPCAGDSVAVSLSTRDALPTNIEW